MSATIKSIISDRNNGLTFLRLILSLLVLWGHCYDLGGFFSDPIKLLTHGQESLGGLAVKSFMLLSGLLVSTSFDRQPLKTYFLKRVLRIFPGFLFSLILITFFIGPILSLLDDRNLVSYFSIQPNGSWSYLFSNCLLIIRQVGILDLLDNNPFPHIIAGSNWTLFPEFKGYFVILACGLCGLLKDFRLLIGPFLFFYILSLIELYIPNSTVLISSLLKYIGLGWNQDIRLLQLGVYLLSGMLFHSLAPKIVLTRKLTILGVGACAGCAVLPIYDLVAPICLGYLLFVLCQALPEPLKCFDKFGDYSYGIYLYHFPVEQVLSQMGLHHFGLFIYLGVTILLTIPLAILSWKGVERPAIKLKWS